MKILENIESVNRRTLFLVVLLIMVAVGAAFYKRVYRKNKIKIRNLKRKIERLKEEIEISKREIPNLKDISIKLAENRKIKMKLVKEESKYEKGILSEDELDDFLNYLTIFEKEKKLDFMMIKPAPFVSRSLKKKNSLPYEEKEFIIKVKGDLERVVDYIYYVNNLSDSAVVEAVDIVSVETDSDFMLQATLQLKALFFAKGNKTNRDELQLREYKKFPEKLNKKVFFKKIVKKKEEIVEEPVQEAKIKVDGVIMMGDKSRVIIEGDIYREGDIVNGLKIKKIYENKVIFEGSSGDIIIEFNES